MPFEEFDRNKLELKPLSERVHDLTLEEFLDLDSPVPPFHDPLLDEVAGRIAEAHKAGREVLLIMGAYLIRAGVSRFIIDLMERGVITHVAGNGAAAIHDFELALIGATTESVAKYIREGQFGLWREMGLINEAVNKGGQGGARIRRGRGQVHPRRQLPLQGHKRPCRRLQARNPRHHPHWYRIRHRPRTPELRSRPGRRGLISGLPHTCKHREQTQGGVVLNFGTAVTGSEVFLKALAMARNVARQKGERINGFTTAVFDIQNLGDDWHKEPPKGEPCYYFRPLKTLLVRTVQDGGRSYYIRGFHRETFPNLWKKVLERLGG